MALAVIAEFDDAFFTALGNNDELMKLINEPDSFEDLYTIQITTSRYANPEVTDTTKLDDDTYTEKDPITSKPIERSYKLLWSDRSFGQKLLRMIYKLFRVLQITVWFYFLPFVVLLGSYFVPYLYQSNSGLKATAAT